MSSVTGELVVRRRQSRSSLSSTVRHFENAKFLADRSLRLLLLTSYGYTSTRVGNVLVNSHHIAMLTDCSRPPGYTTASAFYGLYQIPISRFDGNYAEYNSCRRSLAYDLIRCNPSIFWQFSKVGVSSLCFGCVSISCTQCLF